MVGTIISQPGITVSSPGVAAVSMINGRVLALRAALVPVQPLGTFTVELVRQGRRSGNIGRTSRDNGRACRHVVAIAYLGEAHFLVERVGC
jgi:hypothetical protein